LRTGIDHTRIPSIGQEIPLSDNPVPTTVKECSRQFCVAKSALRDIVHPSFSPGQGKKLTDSGSGTISNIRQSVDSTNPSTAEES
jgi:hypothetical protein